MSPALSNVSISLHLYSSNKPNNPYHSPFVKLECFKRKNNIRAMAAAENRGNLDHLQRATKSDKKRVVPVAPTVPDSENSAVDDGNNGEGNGRSICILERLAIVVVS
ncbi:hypothetical protein V6N12_043104 [Hibiscus sabdariffa]|uniref:Uncharacterized protein n=1 Tax=Hibiscus sabdariffa TaxID=183260 RepID=A0ABR2DI91_9ROSI